MVANTRPGGLAGHRPAPGRHRRRRLLPAVWARQPGWANALHGWESYALARAAAQPTDDPDRTPRPQTDDHRRSSRAVGDRDNAAGSARLRDIQLPAGAPDRHLQPMAHTGFAW